jgi:ankyrin repeat protein
VVAAYGGQERIVRLLLGRHDVILNLKFNTGDTPLLCAVRKGHCGVAGLLFERNVVDPNAIDNNNCTTLIIAVKNGYNGGHVR